MANQTLSNYADSKDAEAFLALNALANATQSNTDQFISQVNKEAQQIRDIEALAKEQGGLSAYNPTLADTLRDYWNNTSRQDLFMDGLLSAGSVFVPALAQAKGLQLTKNAPSALSLVRNGLVREIGEQAAIDALEGQAQQIANTGANIDDSVRIIHGLSKLR